MEQTNKLPSRFQIGDEVMYKFAEEVLKIVAVEFTESKVYYRISYNNENSVYVDSLDISPVEKQEAL